MLRLLWISSPNILNRYLFRLHLRYSIRIIFLNMDRRLYRGWFLIISFVLNIDFTLLEGNLRFSAVISMIEWSFSSFLMCFLRYLSLPRRRCYFPLYINIRMIWLTSSSISFLYKNNIKKCHIYIFLRKNYVFLPGIPRRLPIWCVILLKFEIILNFKDEIQLYIRLVPSLLPFLC